MSNQTSAVYSAASITPLVGAALLLVGCSSAPPRDDGAVASPPVAARTAADPSMTAVLAAHNRLRAQHCAPPLAWSKTLAQTAQTWANALKRDRCALKHSRSKYGENLAMFGPPGTSDGAGVVSDWYGEIKDYDFERPGFAMSTGHFTQVVWKGSARLGCAFAVCADREVWVCNYDPPGNFEGEFPTHVLPKGCR